MPGLENIPDRFWGLFQSENRLIYMEALLVINEEYLYNDYFISREACIQVLKEYFEQQKISLSEEKEESDSERLEPQSLRVLNRLLYFQWLKRVDDYPTLTANITIPDYAAVFIEAFERLKNPEVDEADVYIQNIYANIYSFCHDRRAGIELLKTALYNTSKLNKALQDMLHNMDSFFELLLVQETYGELLSEHEKYVENIVKKKYHLLKTGDNFYRYKNDVRHLLRQIAEDEERIRQMKSKMVAGGMKEEDAYEEVTQVLDKIEQGFVNMERRIANIDSEHNKYVTATVNRLNYLLNSDRSMRGLVIDLLNRLSHMQEGRQQEMLCDVAERVQITSKQILSKELLYRRRGKNRVFEETVVEEDSEDISEPDVLSLNRSKARYSKKQIEDFILGRMENGCYAVEQLTNMTDEEFELLILAYDYSMRRSSPFYVEDMDAKTVVQGRYRYPELVFKKR